MNRSSVVLVNCLMEARVAFVDLEFAVLKVTLFMRYSFIFLFKKLMEVTAEGDKPLPVKIKVPFFAAFRF